MVLWIFGYGSLMWSPGFDYDEKIAGYIKDYKRVFYQGNTDHRGTVGNPGRTVTLVPHKGATCWGIAYGVSGHDKESLVLSYLELREKEYDVRAHLDLYTESCSDVPAIYQIRVYIASTDRSTNMNFLGPAPLEDMACQIARAVGPSGPNTEYLLKLQEKLIELGCQDNDIDSLVYEVQKVLGCVKRFPNKEKASPICERKIFEVK